MEDKELIRIVKKDRGDVPRPFWEKKEVTSSEAMEARIELKARGYRFIGSEITKQAHRKLDAARGGENASTKAFYVRKNGMASSW